MMMRVKRRYISISNVQVNLAVSSTTTGALIHSMNDSLMKHDWKYRLAMLYHIYRRVMVDMSYADRQQYLTIVDDMTDYRKWAILTDSIERYTPDQLACFIEVVGPERLDDRMYIKCVHRFIGFIDHELTQNDTGYRNIEGTLTIYKKFLEPHTFAKITNYLLEGSRQNPDLMGLLHPLLEAYIMKESKNMNIDDHISVLSSMLSHFEPTEVHAEFMKNKLPFAKVSNCMTATMLVDLFSYISLIDRSHHFSDPLKLGINGIMMIKSRIPYLSEWRLAPEHIAYIPLAAVSLLRASHKLKNIEEVWYLLEEGFLENIQQYSHYQMYIFIDAYLASGVQPKSPDLFQTLSNYFITYYNIFKFEDNIYGAFMVEKFKERAGVQYSSVIKDKIRNELTEDIIRSIKLDRSVKLLSSLFDNEHDVYQKIRYYRKKMKNEMGIQITSENDPY